MHVVSLSLSLSVSNSPFSSLSSIMSLDDEDLDSTCSTPYVSSPSSPCRTPNATTAGYFFSAPASPMHYVTCTSPVFTSRLPLNVDSTTFEFDSTGLSMSSADELFLNGKIRPQILDGVHEDENRGREAVKIRSRSLHRKARSLSPLRHLHENDNSQEGFKETAPCVSGSSSRSSSSGRNSKKWIFLKDLLYRSKSEGRARVGEKQNKFWSHISFHQIIKDKKLNNVSQQQKDSTSNCDKQQVSGKKQAGSGVKPANGVAVKRRGRVSAHELHYTKKRAQAEEMKKRTFLPYRQGLLGCLGFSSKGYGALSGFTKAFNPVSSR